MNKLTITDHTGQNDQLYVPVEEIISLYWARDRGMFHDSIEGLVRFMVNSYHVHRSGSISYWLSGFEDSLKPFKLGYDVSKPTKNWIFRKLTRSVDALCLLEKYFSTNVDAKIIIKRYLERENRFSRAEIVKTAIALSELPTALSEGVEVLSDSNTANLAYKDTSENKLLKQDFDVISVVAAGDNSTWDGRDPKTFAELFIKPDDVDVYVDILRTFWSDNEIISETKTWQNRKGSKAVLSAWVRRLEDCDKIHFIRPIERLVPLLNTYFVHLDLGEHARTLKDPDADLLAEFSAAILP